jgi:hypothetical protein
MSRRVRRVISWVGLVVFVPAGLVGTRYASREPDPPGDPNTVVLRTRVVHGGPTVQTLIRQTPELTVYGDGRVITTAGLDTRGPNISVRLWDVRLTGAAYRKMYQEAHEAGLGTAQTVDKEKSAQDGRVLEVEFLVDGKRRFTTVPAGATSYRAWRIMRLLGRLTLMPGRVSGEIVAPARDLPSDRMAIVAARVHGPSAAPEKPWPLARPLADGVPVSCTVLTGTEARDAWWLTDRIDGRQRWRSGGHLYMVNFRQLLPDEDCASVVATRGGEP